MKKTKLISLALAALMVVTLIPFGVFSASAAEIPAMPTVSPDGENVRTAMFADFGEKITTAVGTNGGVENGQWISKSTDTFAWTGSVQNTNARGALGFMFYLETVDESTLAKFQLGIYGTSIKRTGYGEGNNQPRFETTVNTNNGTEKVWPSDDATCVYYTYDGTTWVENVQKAGGDYYIGVTGSSWYFVPFSAFIYNGTDKHVNGRDNAWGLSYADFLENYSGNIGVIENMRIKSKSGSDLKFGDIYMVYAENAAASENAAATPIFTDAYVSNKEVGDTTYSDWTATAENGIVTVGGITGNTTSSSGNRAWISSKVQPTTDITKASGLRFYVDSSSLGTNQLLLRIRLKDGVNPVNILSKYGEDGEIEEYYKVLTNTANGTANVTALSNPQFMLSSANSVAYVYDEQGNLVPYYTDTSNADNSEHNDTIAIPAGYKGYVYIPMDSFYATLQGSTGNRPLISFDKAVELGYGKEIDGMVIVQTYKNSASADYSVSYSDFELVYEDVEVTQTSVSLGNDLALNVKAETKNGATVESATYTIDGKSYTAKVNAIDGGYAIVCDGILPQDAGKTVSVTINGKVGDAAVTNTLETSVKEYCLTLLASDESDAAKNAAADLLRYAAAADTFANETSTILDGATLDGLGTATDFENLSLTNGATATDTTVTGYEMTGAALRLENALALKLFVSTPAEGTETVKATFTLGENEAVSVDIVDGVAVFGGIGACDFGKTITVKLTVGDDEAQTLTYKVLDYFAVALADAETEADELALVKALYNYGASASAYADSISAS